MAPSLGGFSTILVQRRDQLTTCKCGVEFGVTDIQQRQETSRAPSSRTHNSDKGSLTPSSVPITKQPAACTQASVKILAPGYDVKASRPSLASRPKIAAGMSNATIRGWKGPITLGFGGVFVGGGDGVRLGCERDCLSSIPALSASRSGCSTEGASTSCSRFSFSSNAGIRVSGGSDVPDGSEDMVEKLRSSCEPDDRIIT